MVRVRPGLVLLTLLGLLASLGVTLLDVSPARADAVGISTVTATAAAVTVSGSAGGGSAM